MGKRILVVDDNKMYIKALVSKLQSTFPLNRYEQAENAFQALTLIKENVYDLCIVDLVLPDAHDGSLVKDLINDKQSVIVITDLTDAHIRKELISLDIVDYVIKSDTDSFGYLLSLLRRLETNKSKQILVVDDSSLARIKISDTLKRHNFNVIEAQSGEEALSILQTTHIDLVLTDHEMPKMDGLELTKQIRRLFHIEELPLIALTGSSDEAMTARYLKSEANDFIKKPYSKEELLCRVETALNAKSMFEELKTMAITDRLTGIYNRVHLYDRGSYFSELAKRDDSFFTIAIFDIDFFKSINDTYGHMVGDYALCEFASFLKKAFRKTDVVARFGGEEFVVIMPNTTLQQAYNVCNAIREKVAQYTWVFKDDISLSLTVSVGVAQLDPNENFELLLSRADKLLYDAKGSGRNKAVA